VRFANITIIEGNGASQFGIGVVCAQIAEAVVRDARVVLPVAAYRDRYDVTVALPTVVGREGAHRVLEPSMSTDEREAFDASVATLREAARGILEPGARQSRAATPTLSTAAARSSRSAAAR
jgi:L-lactate dehydrogenase